MSGIDVDIAFRYPGGSGIDCAWRESLEPGSVTAWLGASGSGKTTLLRCLAGLESPQRGHIEFNGTRWLDADRRINVPPERRSVGVLFQEYALFPHLTVEQNVRFGTPAGRDGSGRAAELLALFRLEGTERRFPRELSGGQQQRVALARAICRYPSLLLLDEPLSAVDAPIREDLRHELAGLIRESGIPACIITHDRFDALTLADRVVLMDQGRIVQTGATRDVFAQPLNEAAARLVGIDTVLVGNVTSVAGGLAHVAVGGQRVSAEAPHGGAREVALCIRAEDVTVAVQPAGELSAINQWQVTVGSERPEGPFVRVVLDCGFRLPALVTREAWQRLGLTRGDHAWAIVKAAAIRTFPRH